MPVTINEFEVVVDPPRTTPRAGENEAAHVGAPRGATPNEIENILRREKERISRVLAH